MSMQDDADACISLKYKYYNMVSCVKSQRPNLMKDPILNTLNVQPLYTSASTIPEGWQFVPVEPTLEMKQAPWKKLDEATDYKLRTSLVYWREMLAAAPKYGE